MADNVQQLRPVGRAEDVRPMPVTWWPDAVKVTAACSAGDFGFLITQEELQDNLAPKVFAKRLDALRQGLWQAAELKRLGIPLMPGTTNPAA